MDSRSRRPRGQRTRKAILRKAVAIASVEGLEGLTLGTLSSALCISKSGLFAHFGSKEELQCAVVEAAKEIFIAEVIRPASAAQGLDRLRTLCERWLAYAEKRVFPGGCFFAAASLEFDDRPGKVRDRIIELMKQWLLILEEAVSGAQEAHEVKQDLDARQIAFEINALAMGANWSSRHFRDQKAFRAGRHAILQRIELIREAKKPRKRCEWCSAGLSGRSCGSLGSPFSPRAVLRLGRMPKRFRWVVATAFLW